MRNVHRRSDRCRVGSPRLLGIGPLLLVFGLAPVGVHAQGEVSVGALVAPEPGPGGTQVGPALSVSTAGMLGLPVFLDVGIARTDYTSLGQDYHRDHYFLMLAADWFPIQGTTRLGLRLGLGAYGEYETVENPSSPGGDNWIEAAVPGLILERELAGGRRLVVGLTDYLLGWYFAVLDSSEYSIEHRLRLMVGVRF